MDTEIGILRALNKQYGVRVHEEIFVFDFLTAEQVDEIEQHNIYRIKNNERGHTLIVAAVKDLISEITYLERSRCYDKAHFFMSCFGIEMPLAMTAYGGNIRELVDLCNAFGMVDNSTGNRISTRSEACVLYRYRTNIITSPALLFDQFGATGGATTNCKKAKEQEDPPPTDRGRGIVWPWDTAEWGGPWVPEIMGDADAIAADINNRIAILSSGGCSKRFKYVAIGLCCGSACTEVKVLRALKETHGVDILAEIFHDKHVMSSTIVNIQEYVTSSPTATRKCMPKVVVSFDDLSSEIQNLDLQPGSETKLLVFGIHATMSKCREVCMFSRLCDGLCSKELIHPGPFLNYLHSGNRYVHEFTRPEYHIVPGASSGLRVFSGPWSAMTEW